MEQIAKAIEEYISRDSTDYAVLITGKWGSGKTYFWKHTLQNMIEKLEKDGRKFKTVYLSLNGVKDLVEVSRQLFYELLKIKNPKFGRLFDKRLGRALPEVAKIFLNVAEVFGVSFGDHEIDLLNLIELDQNTVLCLDDLERCILPMSELFGFINSFVEQGGTKTVLIANEHELLLKDFTDDVGKPDQMQLQPAKEELGIFGNSDDEPGESVTVDTRKTHYERIKEKSIGKTFYYTPQREEILRSILDQYSGCSVYDSLSENFDLILDVFTKSGTSNLRVLKHAIGDIAFLLTRLLSDIDGLCCQTVRGLIAFVLALSLEVKAGDFVPGILSSLTRETYDAEVLGHRIFENKKSSRLEIFDRTYSPGGGRFFFKFAAIYIETGILDEGVYKAEVELIKKEQQPHFFHGYERLLYNGYWYLSDHEFTNLLVETYELIKNRGLHFSHYHHAFLMFCHFRTMDLIPEYMMDFESEFTEGLDAIRLDEEPVDTLEIKLSENYSGLNEHDKEVASRIREQIVFLNKTARERAQKNDIVKYLELVKSDFDEFCVQLYEKYSRYPVFQYANIERMCDAIMSLETSQVMLLKGSFKQRYEQGQNILRDERNKLQELGKSLELRLNERVKGLNTALIADLAKFLIGLSQE